MLPVWMTAKEAMAYLRISKATFYKLVREGRIRPYLLEGTDEKRYRQDELDKLLKPVEPGKEDRKDGTGQ